MSHMVSRRTAGELTHDDLVVALREAQSASRLNDHAASASRLVARVAAGRRLSPPVADALARTVAAIYAREAELLLAHPGTLPDRRMREAVLRGLTDEATYLDRLEATVIEILSRLLDATELPTGQGAPVLVLEVPVVSLLARPAEALSEVVAAALRLVPDTGSEDVAVSAGCGFGGDLMRRLLKTSQLNEQAAREAPHRLKWPSGSDARALAETYVGGTPLEHLLLATVPLPVTVEQLMSHALIVAGSGHGKTQALEAMIVTLLDLPERVGIVVIDGQRDLIARLMRLRSVRDRLIYVTPTEIAWPPALNIFDLGQRTAAGGDARLEEAMRNATAELLEFVLGGLLGAELTAKQLTPVRFLITLMMATEGASLHDLRAVLDDLGPYRAAVERLSSTARRFFEKEFDGRGFAETRRQIAWRLDGILVNPAFERMFAARESRLDLYAALNAGRIVLFDTAKEHLREEASACFGRFGLAMTLSAVFQRARLPEVQRRPALLFVDEAHEVLDASIETLLRQARKYRLGCVLSTQGLASMLPGLRDTLLANTAIKLTGSVSDRGSELLAANMRTSAAFIHAQSKTATGTRFAAFVRGLTREAVSLPVPFGVIDRAPQLSDGEFAAMLEANRRAVSLGPATTNDSPSPVAPGRDTPGRGAGSRGPSRSGEGDPWERY